MKKPYLLILAAITLIATAGCIREGGAVQTPAKEKIAVDELTTQSFSERMREAHQALKDKPMADQVQAF
jgi:predicted small lipoprotein YifL